MGYVSTGMGDRLSPLLVSLMGLWLALVDQKTLSALFSFFHFSKMAAKSYFGHSLVGFV